MSETNGNAPTKMPEEIAEAKAAEQAKQEQAKAAAQQKQQQQQNQPKQEPTKRAEPERQQQPMTTNQQHLPGTQKVTLTGVILKIIEIVLSIITALFSGTVYLLAAITQPPGSIIFFAPLTAYFALLSAEGYWQAMPGNQPAFLFKPFVEDGASWDNFAVAWSDPAFWCALVVSLSIQCIQAKVLRDVQEEIEKRKKEYEEVKKYKVAQSNPAALKVAEVRRKQYERAGMAAVRRRGFTIILTYVIDVFIAVMNFPLFGVRAFYNFVINAVWMVLSIAGTEVVLSEAIDCVDQVKDRLKTSTKPA